MREKKTGEYIGRALALLVILILVNLVLLFQASTNGIVRESWVDVLWAVDLSLVFQILGNSVLAFYRRVWLEGLLRAMFAGSGLLALIVFFIVFPLDFTQAVGPWLNTVVRVVLLAGMVGAFIDGIVQLLRFIGEGFPKKWGAGESNP
jgi:hypothetical protein